MLDFIESEDDVLAVVVGGKIAGDELQQVMDRLQQSMARHEKVHVFVETPASATEYSNQASGMWRLHGCKGARTGRYDPMVEKVIA